MTDKYSKFSTSQRTELEGDELTRRFVDRYSPRDGFRILLQKNSQGSFLREIEALLEECENELSLLSNGSFPPLRTPRVAYDDSGSWDLIGDEATPESESAELPHLASGSYFVLAFSQPFSREWYAAKIGGLCLDVLAGIKVDVIFAERAEKNQTVFKDILQIGIAISDRGWRGRHKTEILRARKRQAGQEKNGPLGGARTKQKAQDARQVLGQLALAPDTLRRWVGIRKERQVQFLRDLAIKRDSDEPDEDKLFTKSDGGTYALKWYSSLIDEWHGDRLIEKAVDKAMNNSPGPLK